MVDETSLRDLNYSKEMSELNISQANRLINLADKYNRIKDIEPVERLKKENKIILLSVIEQIKEYEREEEQNKDGELKTLNEIQLYNKNLLKANEIGHINWFREKVKEMVIDYLKKYEKHKDISTLTAIWEDEDHTVHTMTLEVAYWLKYIFDISEKDLQ